MVILYYLYSLLWLSLLVGIMAGIYWLLIFTRRKLLLNMVGIFVLAILTRVFVLEIYNIPSESMQDTLIRGDVIMVSKLTYGPKIPTSIYEIPWFGFLLGKKQKLQQNKRRLNGFSKIKRNDIIVFQRTNEDSYYVKRCLGLPGEKLLIRNRKIIVNNNYIPNLPLVKDLYRVNINKFIPVADSLNIRYHLGHFDKSLNFAEVQINTNNVAQLNASRNGNCITPFIADTINTYLHKFYHWNPENFGQVLIPSKGMRIKLTEANYILYKDIFFNNEQAFIRYRNKSFFTANGHLIKYYTFKNNYYFMLGDNRNNSEDSRFWGFLPEMLIEGKVACILFSSSENGFKWDRIFTIL